MPAGMEQERTYCRQQGVGGGGDTQRSSGDVERERGERNVMGVAASDIVRVLAKCRERGASK